MNKDVKQLIGDIQSRGLKVIPQGNGHYSVTTDTGDWVYTLPSSPGDRRWRRNVVSALKRAGVWDRPAVRKDAKGESPPPLPVIPVKEERMPSDGLVTTPELKTKALRLFADVADTYHLNVRRDRVTAHGTVPVLAQVCQAYEAATKIQIPSPDYKDRDTNDRLEMARLCANRASDVAANKPVGMGVSQNSIDSVDYCDEAWVWHFANDFIFPDGRKLEKQGNGMVVTYPEVEETRVTEVVVNDDIFEMLTWRVSPDLPDIDAVVDNMVDNLQDAIDTYRADEPRVDEAPLPTPAFSGNGTHDDRARIAIEVAAHIAAGYGHDTDKAIELATRILNI